MPADNTNHPASATSSSAVSYVSCPEVQESQGSRSTEAASVQDSEDPWTTLGHTPENRSDFLMLQDTSQTKMTVGTAWTSRYNVSPAGKVHLYPAGSEKVSFAIPDGRSVDVHWGVSTEDSKPGEVPLAGGSAGGCSVQLRHDELAVNCNASNGLVSNPGSELSNPDTQGEDDQKVNVVPVWE